MADWKSALEALAGKTSEANGHEEHTATAPNKNKRVGVVYSTDPHYGYAEEETPESDTLSKTQQKLRLSMEKAGRGGKTVTLIRGFVGTEEDMQALAKLLKQRCGVGGTAKEGEIVIQGDHRTKLLEILHKEGYTQAK